MTDTNRFAEPELLLPFHGNKASEPHPSAPSLDAINPPSSNMVQETLHMKPLSSRLQNSGLSESRTPPALPNIVREKLDTKLAFRPRGGDSSHSHSGTPSLGHNPSPRGSRSPIGSRCPPEGSTRVPSVLGPVSGRKRKSGSTDGRGKTKRQRSTGSKSPQTWASAGYNSYDEWEKAMDARQEECKKELRAIKAKIAKLEAKIANYQRKMDEIANRRA